LAAGSLWRLLEIALYRVCLTHARLAGILSELFAGASLPKQVPTTVELDLQRLQSLPI
jgi:hypothetical protein